MLESAIGGIAVSVFTPDATNCSHLAALHTDETHF